MKSIISLAFMILATFSHAQTSNGVVKAYAFSKQVMPGNIPVDEQGNPLSRGPRTEHIIVVETKGKVPPVWKTANINGKIYRVNTFPVTTPAHEVGMQKSNERPIVIKPVTGNKLWHLELEPQENQASERTAANVINQVILNGTLGGKKVVFKIDREIELFSHPSY